MYVGWCVLRVVCCVLCGVCCVRCGVRCVLCVACCVRCVVLSVLQSGLLDVQDVRIAPAVLRLRALLHTVGFASSDSLAALRPTVRAQWVNMHRELHRLCKDLDKAAQDQGDETYVSMQSSCQAFVPMLPHSTRNTGRFIKRKLSALADQKPGIVRCDKGRTKPNRIASGTYTPNSRIQDLCYVHANEETVMLECPQCGFQLASNWYLRKRGTDIPLRPFKPHNRCHRRTGLICHFRPIDGRPSVGDHFPTINLCKHGVPKMRCASCGGEQMCGHGRRRYRCTLCKVGGLHFETTSKLAGEKHTGKHGSKPCAAIHRDSICD